LFIIPRKSRIDIPGALHHIIVRGIERSTIFKDSPDRYNFLERLGTIIQRNQNLLFGLGSFIQSFPFVAKNWLCARCNADAAAIDWTCCEFHSRLKRDHRRFGHLLQNRYPGQMPSFNGF
jgi:hypothetical protein